MESNVIELEYKSSEDMAADRLTKALAREKHNKVFASLKMHKQWTPIKNIKRAC